MKGEKKLDNNSFIQTIVEKCILTNRTGVFDEVYKSFIIQFLLDIETILDDFKRKNREIKLEKERILTKFGNDYKQLLSQICQKSLIVEISEHENSLIGASKEEKYNYFVNNYMAKNFNKIFSPGSPLSNIVSTKTFVLCNAIKSFFDHFCEDIIIIESLLGERVREINEISIGDGDTHNGGKSVYIITLNYESKLVYKPHTLINDEIFRKILEIINAEKKLRLSLRHVKFASMGDHGWQVFVKKNSCSNENEIKDYMYRFGCYVFLCYLLNCTDMHFENIIADKDYPYLIDMETLFTNPYVFKGIRWNKTSSFEKQLCNSVFESALLPMNIAGLKEGQRLDFSGLKGGIRETSIKTNVIVNPRRSDIGYETMELRVDDKLNLNNAVTLNGNKVLPEMYLESLIEGFRDCYTLFLHTNIASKILSIPELRFGKFRQVLRNTKLYYKYLEASYHPAYMNSTKGRMGVFKKLCGSGIASQEHLKVVTAECMQLLNEDIPYFYTGYKTKNLYSCDGLVAEDFFQKTVEDIFRERIATLSKRDLAVQEYFIRVSVYGNTELRKKNYFKIKDKDYNNVFAYITGVHEIQDNCNNSNYFDTIEEGNRYCIGILPFYLYKGGGVAFSLLGLYKFTNNKTYLETFKRMGFINDVSIEEIYNCKKSLGMFDGCGSLLYIAYSAAEVTKDIYYSNKFSDYLSFYEHIDLTCYTDIDIVSGCAGIILFLSNIYEKSRDDQILRIIKRFAERLIYLYKKNKLPQITGFAHGYSGLGVALLKASRLIDDQLSYNIGIDLIRKENQYYLEEVNNWSDLRSGEESMDAWCYGSAGILLSRMEAFKYLKEQHKEQACIDIKRCIRRLKNYSAWLDKDDILCHGTLGNLDVLRQYNLRFGKIEEYDSIRDTVEHKIESKGLQTSGVPGIYSIEFMEGISGYLYHRMREINNQMPCVLLLETF